jgi:hypothetical protein
VQLTVPPLVLVGLGTLTVEPVGYWSLPLTGVVTGVFSGVLSKSSLATGTTGVVEVPVPVTGGPDGGVPVPVATLVTAPKAASAAVSTYEPVQVIVAPIKSVAGAIGTQVSTGTLGSLMLTLVSVTLPVLVPTMV